MSRALLLNATFEPLCVVSHRRAVVLVLQHKAELVEASDHEFRSARLTVPAPAVVRLTTFVRVPFRTSVPLSRRAVFVRDGHRCQYCGRAAENIDHVVPRSRGGAHRWDNVVAACRPCNARKEDHLLAECGMVLRRSPAAPAGSLWLLATAGSIDARWGPYLGAADDTDAVA